MPIIWKVGMHSKPNVWSSLRRTHSTNTCKPTHIASSDVHNFKTSLSKRRAGRHYSIVSSGFPCTLAFTELYSPSLFMGNIFRYRHDDFARIDESPFRLNRIYFHPPRWYQWPAETIALTSRFLHDNLELERIGVGWLRSAGINEWGRALSSITYRSPVSCFGIIFRDIICLPNTTKAKVRQWIMNWKQDSERQDWAPTDMR